MGEMPVMVSICTHMHVWSSGFATHQEQRMLCCASYADFTLIRRNVTTSDRWVTLMISSSRLLPKIRMRNENLLVFWGDELAEKMDWIVFFLCVSTLLGGRNRENKPHWWHSHHLFTFPGLYNMIKPCNCLIIYNQRSFGGSIQGGITQWTAVVRFSFAFFLMCLCVFQMNW